MPYAWMAVGMLTAMVMLASVAGCAGSPPRKANPPATPAVPAATQGRPGVQTTVLALVDAPEPNCVRMTTAADQRTYRLLGPAAPRPSAVLGYRGRGQVLWLTGHAVPHVERADRDTDAPTVPGCPAAGSFVVDRTKALPGPLGTILGLIFTGGLTSALGLSSTDDIEVASSVVPMAPVISTKEEFDHSRRGIQ